MGLSRRRRRSRLVLGNWWSKCPPKMDEKMRRMEGCSSRELACHEGHSSNVQDISTNKHQPVQGAAGNAQKELTKV